MSIIFFPYSVHVHFWLHALVTYLIVHSFCVILSKNTSVISCCDVGVGRGGNMCYQSGVVSFLTDTVGHAVGVLGVGLLDTDWTSWAGRCWSLPACESLGGGSLSSRGSLDRSPFSILTTLLSASRAKTLPSLVQVLLTALCLLTRSSRSLFSGVRSSTIAMVPAYLDYFHSVSPWLIRNARWPGAGIPWRTGQLYWQHWCVAS